MDWALALERPRLDEPEVRVGSVISRRILTCRATDALALVAQIMWERACGCVPVVDDAGQPLSMITDRDICMAAFTRGKKLTELTAGGACSRRLFVCHSDLPLASAAEIMIRAQVRRAPVVAGDGRLIGIITLSHLIRHASFARSRSLPADGAQRFNELLEAVSRPRQGSGNGLARMTLDERETLAMFDAP